MVEPTGTQILEALIDLRDGMAQNFARVYRRFDSLDHRIDALDRRVGRLETRIEDIERRLPA